MYYPVYCIKWKQSQTVGSKIRLLGKHGPLVLTFLSRPLTQFGSGKNVAIVKVSP